MREADTRDHERAGSPQAPVALVTGAAGELGSAITAEFVARGYAVASCGPDLDALESICDPLDGRAVAIRLDVTSPVDCANALARVQSDFGRLDVLVNNAAIWVDRPFSETTDGDWERVMATNVIAPARLSRLFCPLLAKSSRPRIVMIGSKNGMRSEHGLSSYDVSKAALAGLCRSLAVELAPLGILVNCVAPGVLDTRSNHEILTNPDLARLYRMRIPLGRFGSVEGIAKLVAFLSGDDCEFITGSVFSADGGQLAGDALPDLANS